MSYQQSGALLEAPSLSALRRLRGLDHAPGLANDDVAEMADRIREALADSVREHLAVVHGWGMTWSMIAAAADLPLGNVRTLAYAALRCDPRTAVAILQVGPHPVASATHALSCGYRRRHQALAARGWGLRTQARLLGTPTQVVRDRCHLWVVPRPAWTAMARLYTDLSGRPGPDRGDAAAARAAGWPAPLDWHVSGADIDHPDTHVEPAEPGPNVVDPLALDRVRAGGRIRLSRAEQDLLLGDVVRGAGTARDLARWLGISMAAAEARVARARRRAAAIA